MGVYGIRNDVFKAKNLETTKLTISDNSFPVSYVIPKTATVASGSIVSGWNIHAATTAKLSKHLVVQPAYPCVLGVIANAVGSAGATDRLTFVGYDAAGKTVREIVAVQSTAAGINYTNNAFSQITSITPSNTAGIVPKSTSVGVHQYTRKIGLPYPIATSGPSAILAYTFDGTHATAARIGTVSVTYGTILKFSQAVAAKTIQIVYKTNLQA